MTDDPLVAEAAELAAQLQYHTQMVRELAARRKQVYMKLQRAGYSTREMADITGISQARVSQILSDAVYISER